MSFECRESISIPTNEDVVEKLLDANQKLSSLVDKLKKENMKLNQKNKHLKEEVQVLSKALENTQINIINTRLLKLEERVFALENSGVYNTKPWISPYTVTTGDPTTGKPVGTPNVVNSSNKTYTIEEFDDFFSILRK